MIKIFTDQKVSQDLCTKIHNFLSANCPNYSASVWQVPVTNEKNTQWFVKIPPEFEKTLYDDNQQIKVICKAETDKAILTLDKPPADWYGASVIEEKIIK